MSQMKSLLPVLLLLTVNLISDVARVHWGVSAATLAIAIVWMLIRGVRFGWPFYLTAGVGFAVMGAMIAGLRGASWGVAAFGVGVLLYLGIDMALTSRWVRREVLTTLSTFSQKPR